MSTFFKINNENKTNNLQGIPVQIRSIKNNDTLIFNGKNWINTQAGGIALIIVDPQNDFSEQGSLPTPNGNIIFPEINRLRISYPFNNIFISMDSHPMGHISFASSHPNKNPFTNIPTELCGITYLQDLWPDHCIVNTQGWQINSMLDYNRCTDIIVLKGTFPYIDSYSAFGDQFNNRFEKTRLIEDLHKNNINTIVICGLATDFCVQATALDGKRLGFKVIIILTTIAGITPESSISAIENMKANGVIFFNTVDDFLINYSN